MAARRGERRLNAAGPEFFPMRIAANPNFDLCPPPHQPWQPTPLWLPPPPLLPPPRQPPLPPHRPPSYWPAESFSRRNRGRSSRRMSAGPRNAGFLPPPPRMRVLSSRRQRSTAAMTEISKESSADDDQAVYKRIVEHRAFHPSRFRKAERRKMPLKPGHSTVMICNIPNEYTRKMLMEFLDEHCAKENKKLLDNGSSSRGDDDQDSSTDNGVISAYDFLYLLFDLRYM